MGRRLSSPEAAGAIPDPFPPELQWPFGCLNSLNRDELRESAYEIFFTACRSTSGTRLAGRDHHEGGGSSPGAVPPTSLEASVKNMVVTSRLKRALGLRTRKVKPMGKARPMTSAEIMQRQMGVTEQSDNRVRKTLIRSLVGPQKSKKAESLVLPMELLRHLKPSEFGDANEHHSWQVRQLKVLEAGLVSHPSVPLDRPTAAASTLRETVRSTELQTRPLNVRSLSVAVMALARRSVEICHWADGYPLNVHLYLSLLRAVFDLRDETAVLDEVDELLELIKKTWSMLGINRMIHNVCFTWLLFERYVVTGQIEPDLLSAALAMLQQVAGDAKKADREPGYVRVLSATLASVYSWAETKLLDYHEAFGKGSMGAMEIVVSLAVSAAEMLSLQDVVSAGSSSFAAGDHVERYIKSSVRHAFTKLHDQIGASTAGGKMDSMIVEADEDPSETLMYVAARTKDLGRVEKELYGPALRRWHPCPAAVAAVTLHGCFGALLMRCVSQMANLSGESVRGLNAASKLDRSLVQMALEDSSGCGQEDRDKMIKQMAPYEVDSIIFDLIKGWMDERLRIGAECVRRARNSESWNPKSKGEPYAESAVDLMKLAKMTADELLEIQAGAQPCREELLQHLVDGTDRLVHQYASLVASSCGSKESYVPPLPPLTRCNQDSKLLQLWKKAAPPCQVGIDDHQLGALINCGDLATTRKLRQVATPTRVRPTISRGTQRLYVRLNTLHYLLAVLHSIDKSLALRGHMARHRRGRSSAFDRARSSLDAAVLHVSELSARRLIFLDSAHDFHQALYQGGVAGARIQPALRVMKQNLAFLSNVLIDRAQPHALREVLKASMEAFLMVLLAGGTGRAFSRADYGVVAEDFASLKRLFCSCKEGLVAEEVVEREAATAEGVVALMVLSTEKLINEFMSRSTSTAMAPDESLPMALPPTPRRWSRSDANTILRVLCHRDDEAASRFLKRVFDLPKRR